MTKRIRLTKDEISYILGVAGDALASETLYEVGDTDEQIEARVAVFENGMDKLREMLARMEAVKGVAVHLPITNGE